MNSTELQNRLIDFAVLVIQLTRSITKDPAGSSIINQIVRSGNSVALNYGEALGAESTKDFVHKMQIVLKELRETWVSLQILKKANLSSDSKSLEITINCRS